MIVPRHHRAFQPGEGRSVAQYEMEPYSLIARIAMDSAAKIRHVVPYQGSMRSEEPC